jgi:uncharacterized membrane protein YhaH (DUF805 family)
MKWYLKVLTNYATFSGRARRKEYWMFFLFNMIFMYALVFIGVMNGFELLGTLYILITLVPSLAVGVRRMHDVDKSGWYLLVPIYSLVLACTEGTPGDNEYGPDPKREETGDNPEVLHS